MIFQGLATAALQNLKKNFGRTLLIDRTELKRNALTGGKILAAAAFLAEQIKKLPETRIGIALPPGAGGTVANLAVALAGKSSVNLNFTVSKTAAEQMLSISGVKTIISAQLIKTKFKDFPWLQSPEGFWDLKSILSSKSAKKRIASKFLQAAILPSFILEKVWDIKKDNPSQEAMLLFSSGSTGQPKGIPLTHANILANLSQIEAIDLLPPKIHLLANLPLFHSFGLTVTLWYPLTHPVVVASYPNPLDADAIGTVVDEEKINVMVGTASLYRLYLNRVPKEKFESLHFVVAGAEKTPKGLHERWQSHFGSKYLEGYGLTETSPVTNVNLPGKNKIGTVGKTLGGIKARITDVSTGEVLVKPGERGVIEFQGPNVFSGYLNDPKLNSEVFRDGWLWTGDLGSIDAEGYITVDGRLKRFSKIAGEMVPHGAIEEAILKIFGWEEEALPPVAVTGIADEAKGEQLIIVSEREINMAELREKLSAAGIPNLWIPKKLVRVEAIPLLSSGKLDLQKLKELVQNKN